MKKSHLLGAVCACAITIVMPVNSEAALVEVDWQTAGDGLLTRDTVSGLEWMDINPTYYITANQMLALFAPGQLYEGFRFATTDDLITVLTHAGVSENHQGSDIGEADEVSAFIALVGGGSVNNQQTFVQVTANGRTVETVGFNTTLYLSALSYYNDGRTFFSPRFITEDPNRPDADGGNWIVRTSVVPIPPALWLFSSGLLGLIGVARKKAA